MNGTATLVAEPVRLRQPPEPPDAVWRVDQLRTAPTVEAYRAADWFILSAVPDPFAFVGLRRAMDALQISMERGSARGRLLGVLLSVVTPGGPKARRPKLEAELLDYARKRLDVRRRAPVLFKTRIARTAMIPRAQMEGRTLLQTRPNHKVSGQYRELAKEVEQRIRRLRRPTTPRTR